MDYCSSCRRHLNGALVCPGCGAYAPDIDPAAYAHAAQTPVAMMSAGLQATTQHGDFDTWEDTGPGGEPEVAAAQPVAEGRAARRRQRARWKKNQRRAVVATAVALVSGSVTMVAMDQQPSDQTRAATAPEEPGTDIAEELTGQYGSPAVRRSDEPRSTPTPAATERSSRHIDAGSARTVPSDNRTEMAAPPREAQTSVSQPGTTTPSTGGYQDSTGTSGGSDTPAAPVTPPPPPPPSADDGTPTQPPATQDPSTPPQPRDPRLCLLVICLG